MDYGADLLLQEDDIVFTADGDVSLVTGPAMIAQDIDQTLKITPGALYWDKDMGSTMLLMLNDAEAGTDSAAAELERVAIADIRVNPESVKAYRIEPGKYRLEFTPMAAVRPETLDIDLTKDRKA